MVTMATIIMITTSTIMITTSTITTLARRHQ